MGHTLRLGYGSRPVHVGAVRAEFAAVYLALRSDDRVHDRNLGGKRLSQGQQSRCGLEAGGTQADGGVEVEIARSVWGWVQTSAGYGGLFDEDPESGG